MLPIKIGKKNYRLPLSWDQVSFKNYCKMVTAAKENNNRFNFAHVLSSLLPIDFTTANNVDWKHYQLRIEPHLKWIETLPTPDKLTVPSKVILGTKEIPVKILWIKTGKKKTVDNIVSVPKDMKECPYGFVNESTAIVFPTVDGKMMLRNPEWSEFASELIAINLQQEYSKQYTGEDMYDRKVIEEIMPMIDELPCTQVIALANFFFHRFRKLTLHGQTS